MSQMIPRRLTRAMAAATLVLSAPWVAAAESAPQPQGVVGLWAKIKARRAEKAAIAASRAEVAAAPAPRAPVADSKMPNGTAAKGA